MTEQKKQPKFIIDTNTQQDEKCCMPFYSNTHRFNRVKKQQNRTLPFKGINLISTKKKQSTNNLALKLQKCKLNNTVRSSITLNNPKIHFSYKLPVTSMPNPPIITPIKKISDFQSKQHSKYSYLNSTSTCRLASTIKTYKNSLATDDQQYDPKIIPSPYQNTIHPPINNKEIQTKLAENSERNPLKIRSIKMDDIREVVSEIDNSESPGNNNIEISQVDSNEELNLKYKLFNRNLFLKKVDQVRQVSG